MDQRGILTTYKLPDCCDRFKIVQSFLIAIWLWFGGNFEFERFSIKDLLRPLSVCWKARCSRQTLEIGG